MDDIIKGLTIIWLITQITAKIVEALKRPHNKQKSKKRRKR